MPWSTLTAHRTDEDIKFGPQRTQASEYMAAFVVAQPHATMELLSSLRSSRIKGLQNTMRATGSDESLLRDDQATGLCLIYLHSAQGLKLRVAWQRSMTAKRRNSSASHLQGYHGRATSGPPPVPRSWDPCNCRKKKTESAKWSPQHTQIFLAGLPSSPKLAMWRSAVGPSKLFVKMSAGLSLPLKGLTTMDPDWNSC